MAFPYCGNSDHVLNFAEQKRVICNEDYDRNGRPVRAFGSMSDQDTEVESEHHINKTPLTGRDETFIGISVVGAITSVIGLFVLGACPPLAIACGIIGGVFMLGGILGFGISRDN